MTDPYLASSDWVDSDHPAIIALSRRLCGRSTDPAEIAQEMFQWVRDEVRHAGDHFESPTTCRASEVLQRGQGWCFGKAHLLAALLRASSIRAALVYQRLSLDGEGAPFALHGLVAVDLPGVGWYRLDPRGNKPGVDARFTPPVERLAFTLGPHDVDLQGFHASPLSAVVGCLTTHATWEAVLANLPDVS